MLACRDQTVDILCYHRRGDEHGKQYSDYQFVPQQPQPVG
jgi:hypothetical protein